MIFYEQNVINFSFILASVFLPVQKLLDGPRRILPDGSLSLTLALRVSRSWALAGASTNQV